MANFAVPNSSFGAQQAMTTTYKSVCWAAASTQSGGATTQLKRGKVYDILIGTNTAPADNYLEYALQRATIVANATWAGEISSISSAFALDQADGAVSGHLSVNASAETNITSRIITWYVGVNQRASYRWVAAPGSEFIYPAVSSGTGGNGLVLCAQSGAYTGTVTGTILVSEQ